MLPRRADHVATCRVAGALVLISLSAPAGELAGDVCVLNDTGSEVWGLVDGRRDMASIAGQLAKWHGVTADAIEQDVAATLEDLVSGGYLRSDAGPADPSPP